jgi:precorrin-8X/cobalt-precorrin-8 methylmutase
MKPEQIEEKSFQLIEARVSSHSFNRRQWSVVKRMIHATADFELVHTTAFHPRALQLGMAALRGGAPIIADTNMVKAGISLARLRPYGTKICCAISRPAVAKEARRTGKTRAAAAMRALAPLMKGSLVAVGNAPTALREVLAIAGDKACRPALIIGVPVGMVGAAESKEMLIASGLPFITVRGEKGGSPLAASVVNALALLSAEMEHA